MATILNGNNTIEATKEIKAELQNRFNDSVIRATIFDVCLEVAETLIDGKAFNKTIATKFEKPLQDRFNGLLVKVRYDQDYFNYKLIISVENVKEDLTISVNNIRAVNKAALCKEIQKWIDIRNGQKWEYKDQLDKIDQIESKIEAINNAYKTLGSALVDFVDSFDGLRYAVELDTAIKKDGKGLSHLYLNSYIKR